MDPPESTSRREEVLASGQPASQPRRVGLGIGAVIVVVVVVNIGRTWLRFSSKGSDCSKAGGSSQTRYPRCG